ncbi:DivIVA domain-containing protein [Limosilactobacillus equigenerosi]|uniref:Cell cycle protein GpsB n=1 Tax=Limosilactobacillus equigenerosi DSM 18793 = JCM 14505 TaxID=1423742 RepID=A0A0R1UQY0_9LACO|nr:DivIVA domain-containing protein [Limosilactobacillus equigenerosi]KRL94010.1 hypothetical protein FC21_GL001482 [Limosilactobacillus equigenerosi DSM 18793 = JCM 14505]
MVQLNFTPEDILDKQFIERGMGKGYDRVDVDTFLDDVIKDYYAYEAELKRLETENQRLEAELTAAQTAQPVSTPAQPTPVATVNPTPQVNPSATLPAAYEDLARRVANLERQVFGATDADANQYDEYL